jgi:histidine triad (HIT) family protein
MHVPTIFTRIIDGELPGRFVWRDPQCVAFLSASPLRPGHVLVVPRVEVDHWIDMDPVLSAHVFSVAQRVAKGVASAFPSVKVALVIAGLEVRHCHVHLVPIDALHDLDFDRQDRNPDPHVLDAAAERIRAALRRLGNPEASA